jgi:hypothetical protein
VQRFSVPWKRWTSTADDHAIIDSKDQALRDQIKTRRRHEDEVSCKRQALNPIATSIEASDTLYQQLPKGHIRILEVLPGNFDDSIQCCLHTAALMENKLAYDALSYTWEIDDSEEPEFWEEDEAETSAKEKEVFFACKKITILVHVNLHNAIRRLRDTQVSKHIWVS